MNRLPGHRNQNIRHVQHFWAAFQTSNGVLLLALITIIAAILWRPGQIALLGLAAGILVVWALDSKRRALSMQSKLRQLGEEHATLSAQHSELKQRIQEQDTALRALNEGAAALNATLDLDGVLARILRQLESIVQFDSASVFLVDGEDLRIIAARGLPQTDSTFSISIIENQLARRILTSDGPVVIDDVQQEVSDFIPEAGEPIRAWIGTALRVGERAIGVLAIDSHTPYAYDAEDSALVAGFARQAALALYNAQIYDQARRQASETELLLELTRAVGSTLYLPEVLLRAASAIAEATEACDVTLLLFDEAETRLVPQAGTTTGEHSLRGLWSTPPLLSDEPLLAAVLNERCAQVIELPSSEMPPTWQAQAELLDLHTLLLLPLVFKDHPLGLVVIALDKNVPRCTPARLSLAEGLATSAALAIEHARLFEQARRAAILEERSRLARELHDSVTQQLFSLSLTAQAACGQVRRNPERAIEQLQRLQAIAQQSLGEMRDLLLQLRPTPLREGGLVPALHEHIARLSCQGGPAISLHVEGDSSLINGHERGLYRIAQEALSNVLRHSHATQAKVQLSIGTEQLRLEVRDNGCGFDPHTVGNSGKQLGLRSIAERAAEMKGQMRLESRPGDGTIVTVEVPLHCQRPPVINH